MKILAIHLFILALALFSPVSWSGDAGQTLTDVGLKGEPFADAQTVGTLPAKAAVEIIKRQGGWLQIKTAEGLSGWAKMTSIKLEGGDAAKPGSNGLVDVFKAAQTGRSGNTGVTVATGVRGLSPEDLKNAKPNPDEVKKLDSFAATKPQAESLANKAKLTSQKVEYLADTKSSGGK
jgi:hypothetical protein